MLKQADMVPKDIEEQWQDAMAEAKARLARNRKEIGPAQARCVEGLFPTSALVATSLWLDELSQLFGCLPVGHMFPYYDMESFNLFKVGLCKKANAAPVAVSLGRARDKMQVMWAKTYDCNKRIWEMKVDDWMEAEVPLDLVRKLKVCKQYEARKKLYAGEWSGEDSTEVLMGGQQQLLSWMCKWNSTDKWSSRGTRKKALSELKAWAYALMVTAQSLSYKPKHEEQWLDMEARAILGWPQHTPHSNTPELLFSRKRKERETARVDEVQVSLFSKKRKEKETSGVNEVQVQVTAFSKPAVSDLQEDFEDEGSQKLNLVQYISRLQVEKDRVEATAALDRLRFAVEMVRAVAEARSQFDEEKVPLRQEFDEEKVQLQAATREEAQACQICMEKPHNVIIFPCSHAHYCEDCVETFRKTNNTCPTCRAVITGLIRYIL